MKNRLGIFTMFCALSVAASSMAQGVDQGFQAAIAQKGREASGILGKPTGPARLSEEDGSAMQTYERGVVIWSPHSGAHEVHGAILDTYLDYSMPGPVLGFPITDEMVAPDGVGRYSWFGVPGRVDIPIYWHPDFGAFVIWGDILASWSDRGYERGLAGYPAGPEERPGQGFCPGATEFFLMQRFQYQVACWDAKSRIVRWYWYR